MSVCALAGCESRDDPQDVPLAAAYVGSERCGDCHASEFKHWQDSHHAQAMVPVQDDPPSSGVFTHAGETTDFALGESSVVESVDIVYTFGTDPLKQYLVSMPDGRLQAHSVAWDSRPEAEGGQRYFHLVPDIAGTDDVLHWTGPAATWNFMCADCHSTAVEKNYDADSGRYETAYAEVSVGCEACHGAGSIHVEEAEAGKPAPLFRMETQDDQLNGCAQCHSRRSQLAEVFTPDRNYLDFYLPTLIEANLYHPDGQILDEVYVWGSFLQSPMSRAGVTCSDCHDPHAGEVRIEGNGLCTQCHNPGGRADFPTLNAGNYDTPDHHRHVAGTPAAQCVSCHMRSETYMVIDDRRDHSFRVPRPDVSAALGTPDPCNDCHQDETAEWAAQAVERWYPETREPHYGHLFAAAWRGDRSDEAELANLASDETTPRMTRTTAMALLGGYSQHQSSRVVMSGLRDSDPLIRLAAARASTRWPAADRWNRVRHLLTDPVLAVRTEATMALMDTIDSLDSGARQTMNDALRDHLEVLSFNSDRAEGLTNIAGVHRALGEFGPAELALDKALEKNPKWIPAYLNKADILSASGRDPEAGPLIDAALEIVPEASNVLLAKALWMVRQGEREAALPLLEKAWQASPAVDQYLYVYAVGLHSANRSADALEILEANFAEGRRSEQLVNLARNIARDSGNMAAMSRLLDID